MKNKVLDNTLKAAGAIAEGISETLLPVINEAPLIFVGLIGCGMYLFEEYKYKILATVIPNLYTLFTIILALALGFCVIEIIKILANIK